MICPICNKEGLEQTALKCPQCNSDLEQFQIVSQIEMRLLSSKRKRNLPAIIVCLILLLTIAIVYVVNTNEQKNVHHSEADGIVDSLNLYKNKFTVATKHIDSLEQTKPFIVIDYRVRQGDNLHTLASMFYNDATRASDLARENGLRNPDIILIGQMLKVKITR